MVEISFYHCTYAHLLGCFYAKVIPFRKGEKPEVPRCVTVCYALIGPLPGHGSFSRDADAGPWCMKLGGFEKSHDDMSHMVNLWTLVLTWGWCQRLFRAFLTPFLPFFTAFDLTSLVLGLPLLNPWLEPCSCAKVLQTQSSDELLSQINLHQTDEEVLLKYLIKSNSLAEAVVLVDEAGMVLSCVAQKCM